MINAELSHNPYLLQTSVRFNGQMPRINSQVEKYEKVTLKDWIEKVPKIFHDEMNGYDFELLFTGTKSDFESLRVTFETAGITQDMVRLFHKNELEDAETKSSAIDALIQWLKEHPNRKFDFREFYDSYADFFESAYPYIIVNGHELEEIYPDISIEMVKTTGELQNTILTNTPILFFIEPQSSKEFREDLVNILNRKDVRQNQLFFMIHPQLKKEQVRRVIVDLGVENPQIVSSYGDESVLMYFRDYPITEYVREAILIFEEKLNAISAILEEENRESKIQNSEIHSIIDGIEKQLRYLKNSDLYFTERDNFDTGTVFEDLLTILEKQIGKWRNRKTKVVGDAECEAAANDYNAYIAKHILAFNSAMMEAYRNIVKKIHENFLEHYTVQGMDPDFEPDITAGEAENYKPISLVDAFISTKEEIYEEKNDRMAFLRFGSAKKEKERVRVVTAYYANWREKALEFIIPAGRSVNKLNIEKLTEYYNKLAEAFHDHLSALIEVKEREKDKASSLLSDDERKLQEDNDWFAEFREQLARIERG